MCHLCGDVNVQVISGPLFQESWVELDAEVAHVEAAGHNLHSSPLSNSKSEMATPTPSFPEVTHADLLGKSEL